MADAIQVQCRDCAKRGRCADELRMYREALFLWHRGAEPLRCQSYREDVMVAIGYAPHSPLVIRGEQRMIR